MKSCNTEGCSNRGRSENYGWCDACSYDHLVSIEVQRADAERLAKLTGRPWLVVELHPSSTWAIRARKLGKTAYEAFPALSRASLELAGYKIVETVEPAKSA